MISKTISKTIGYNGVHNIFRQTHIYMVLLIIIPFLNGYFIGNINPTFSDKPISFYIILYHTGH